MVDKIQWLIRGKGLHQADFEPLVGLPKGRISKWASGQGEPTARQSLRIARNLKVPIEYLIDDEMEAVPDPLPSSRIGEDEAERQLAAMVRRYGADRVYWRLVEIGMGEASPVRASVAGDDTGSEDDSSRSPRRTGFDPGPIS